MPLFLTEEEYCLCSHDPALIVDKADSFIFGLRRQLESARAEADAASVTAEQTYNVLEQRYAALLAELAGVQAENAELSGDVERRAKELALARSGEQESQLVTISKDGEIERMKVEASELHKSKRQLLEVLAQKDVEIGEKNATIQSYLDKIVKLTENATKKEGSLHDSEAELARCQATCARLSQEKELIEKHNKWLNEELNDKVNSLAELRKSHMEFEEDTSNKLIDMERKLNESSRSLKKSEERVKEYSLKITSIEEELISCKNAATTTEGRYMAELSTVTKLVDLYKESSAEWSKKAGELEGVIKALETHLSQVENDYKDKLEKEISARKAFERDAMDMKEKFQKCEVELQNAKISNEPNLLQISSIPSDDNLEELWSAETDFGHQNNNISVVVPKVPVGISGTSLAASLLRDGWSLAKMYEKYHEAADALRHERWERKHSEAILERVLQEIEQKADAILEERAEHEKMVDAYTSLNQKLQQALSETDTYESTIRTLKAELKKQERDYSLAQKEISDLQKQVTVLLKQCRDAQIRCGVEDQVFLDRTLTTNSAVSEDGRSVNELAFKDINELVQQNSQLRNLVHNLSNAEKTSIAELKENFHMEIQKKTDDAASKVEAILKRCEEQTCMIESLHGSVAMYKRLYEEQNKIQSSGSKYTGSGPVDGKKDLLLLFEGSQETAKKVHEQFAQRARCLEDDLAKSRNEVMELRLERDKFSMETKFASDKLDNFIKELEHQRDEANGVRARNVELSQLLIDYQRRIKESSDMLRASEELSRKLSVEVSILKNEKEILKNAEKRATDEIHGLSERAQRLQASLDTIHSVEEVRGEIRLSERRKLEEDIQRVEKEWADVKKELQEEHDHVHVLKIERERAEEASKQQVDQMRRELSDAWRAVSSAESKAAVAEARFADLERLMKSTGKVVDDAALHNDLTNNKINGDFWKVREELEELKEEAQANKNYMMQYKEIAQTNETALKQIELTHHEFKAEAEKLKSALETEIVSLKEKISDLESQCALKSTEAFSEMAAKEDAISSAAAEIAQLKEECSCKMAKIGELETQSYSLKEAFDTEHKRWRSAQDNYERQVVLLSETIQELNKTSLAQASLQDEVAELRKLSDNLKAENEMLKVSWQSERTTLLESKQEAERKYNEIDEQNKILHNHLEALHIKLADTELSSSAGRTGSDAQGDSKLQSVINYLRHAKEIAYTEVTLLRQEKIRLQSQLESALKASERVQAQLQSERENARKMLFTDEEFESLQLKVREINLLRESNAQLREENKHNYEECQKFREMAQKAKLEGVQMANEKDIAVQGFCKEIDMLKEEKGQLELRVAELLEKFRNIDIPEYERLKEDIQHKEVKLKERDAEIELSKKLLVESQESLSNLEQEFAKCRKEFDEQQKKMSDIMQTEVTLKSDFDRQKKMAAHFKKKLDNLTKEKEGLNKENHTLLKQIEDYKSGKRAAEVTSEDAIKGMEKDTRIQMLEKTLEREREDLRKEREENKKEKSRRTKTESTVVEHVQKFWQEKKKLLEEIRMYKHGVCNVLESVGITANQLPSETGLEEQTAAYFFSVGNFEEAVNTALGDGLDVHPVVADSSSAEAAIEVSGQQLSKPVGPTIQHGKSTEQMEKDLPKLIPDARKTVRKLIRPRLDQSEEPAVDNEASDMECSTAIEGKVGESREEDPHASVHASVVPPSRKRLASTSTELREDSFQHESESDALPLKKSKVSEPVQEGAEEQPVQPSESPIILPIPEDVQDIVAVQPHEQVDEGIADARKDEKLGDSRNEPQEHPNDPMDGPNQDDEARNELDTISDLDKPKEIETIDELPKNDEVQELPQPTMLAEDDVEEGELAPGDQDLQLEDGELGGQECPGDATGIEAIENDEGAEVAYVEDLNEEKTDNASNIDENLEVSDKSNNNDQASVDVEESRITSSSTQIQSSNIPVDAATTEQLPVSAAAEVDESRAASSSRRIVIAQRAKENSLLRQAGMMTRVRGRGRVSGGFRGDAALGGRGGRGRGGRGQASNDREQG